MEEGGLGPSATPYQLQQYDNNNNERESGDVRNNNNVEGFCLKRVYGTEHPDYQHFPDWFTSNIMTLQPPYHSMIHNKPEMLSTMHDDLWNQFRDLLTKAIHSRRRDGFLIAIGAMSSFLFLYWPEGTMDQLLENNKYIHTFIHVFIGIFVGSFWLYLWLIVSDRVKQTIKEFNVHSLEINVKVKLERYYRVTSSSSGSGLHESVYILFIKQQQQQLQNLSGISNREPSDIESSRNATWYEMERYVLRLT